MKRGKIFLLKTVKFCGLLMFICYSIAVCVANVLYYKYEKKEVYFFPKINFGIDIVGGNQLTVSIDVSGAMQDAINNNQEFLLHYCEDKKFKCNFSQNKDGNFLVTVTKQSLLEHTGLQKQISKDAYEFKKEQKQFVKELRSYIDVMYDIDVVKSDEKSFIIRANINQKGFKKMLSDITDKTILILKNRIDGVGVNEIAVQRYGSDKIVILVPRGVDISRIKNIINTTAKLDFYLMDSTHIFSKLPEKIMKDHIILPSYTTATRKSDVVYMVENKPALNGDCISNVQPVIDGISNSINFRMNSSGAKKFSEITKNNIGRLLAIVLDGKVLMAPIINTQIVGGGGSITGHFSSQEVKDLSVLLRSGSLPAKISIISERLLGSMFDKNVFSFAGIVVLLCLVVVVFFMVSRYRGLGLIVPVSLLLNFIFTITIISVFNFTLTLPGIAGLVLMLGMATDANILIYEKMKELKRQNIEDPKTIIKNSFSKAFKTILDSNITTIIAGIALFSFGGSFIKGFSITLVFGILCSMFTSVNITKMIIDKVYSKRKAIII